VPNGLQIAECGIDGLRKHNPLDDSRASVYFLLKEIEFKLIHKIE